MPVAALGLSKAALGSAKARSALNPEGSFMGNNKELIILIMAGSAVLVFVQNTRRGQPQDGRQYVAIGVVGFFLLFFAEFAPSLAFAFALLFGLSVILNSPNGVPIVASKKVG
jgi:hypothetical protein